MAVNFKAIGNRIKQKRKEKGLTQEHLAERLFLSVGYISNIERGTTKINLTTLSDIADILECDVSELVSHTSTGNKNYLSTELNELIGSLNDNEKNMVLQLLNTYVKQSKYDFHRLLFSNGVLFFNVPRHTSFFINSAVTRIVHCTL